MEIAHQSCEPAFQPVSVSGSDPVADRIGGIGRTYCIRRSPDQETGAIGFAITGIIGASALAVPMVNLFVTLILPPRTLPRLDFSHGIPASHRTMVVVPTLLSKPQEVDDLLEALEIRYLGNRDPNLFFALLTDFRDAPQCTQPEDDTLLAYARTAVQALNATYQDDRSCIFYLLHRPRVWNPHERVWMGYERKRGKLEQFNALLRGGEKRRSRILSERNLFSHRSSMSLLWIPIRSFPAMQHAP